MHRIILISQNELRCEERVCIQPGQFVTEAALVKNLFDPTEIGRSVISDPKDRVDLEAKRTSEVAPNYVADPRFDRDWQRCTRCVPRFGFSGVFDSSCVT